MKRKYTIPLIGILLASIVLIAGLTYERGPIVYPASPQANLYAASTTKQYELGTRYVTEDGRVFRYARAGTYGVVPGYGGAAVCTLAIGENLHIAASAGDITVTVVEDSITKDKWAGGYIVVGHGSQATTQNRKIVSNTASDSDTNHVVITLDGALTADLTTSSYCEVIPNIYYDVENISAHGNEFTSYLGIPATVATSGEYFWLQTWGPCWIVPGGGDAPGDTARERSVYFVGDGSVNGLITAGHTTGLQCAGFIIQKDSSGTGGPPFVMLQISP